MSVQRLGRLVAVVSLGVVAACNAELPHENGLEWDCSVLAERGGLVVGSHPADGRLWVCGNADVDPLEVQSVCESDCEDKWCTFSLTASLPFPISVCTDATCRWQGPPPTPTGVECVEDLDPGGPAHASLDLVGDAVVTADGNSGNANDVTGFLRYSITDCGGPVCPISFAEIDLTVPAFDIDGHDITATIHNGPNANGLYFPDLDLFQFMPGAIQIAANFTLDGESGATALSNSQAVAGFLDPEGDLFSLVAIFEQDGVSIDITSLTGLHTNRPPVAVIRPESPIECTGPSEAAVVLDGALSTDVDDDIERFEWRVDGEDVGFTEVLPYVLPLGESFVELTVFDSLSAFDKEEQTLEVVDTTAPTLTLSLSATELSPPNHKLRTITANITTSDVCDAAASVKLVSITSNEPDNGLGDGDVPFDIQNAAFGTDDRSFALRSERGGGGNNRVYTVTYEVTDGSGNTTVQQATVTVPKGR
jgi:hypothetical protein